MNNISTPAMNHSRIQNVTGQREKLAAFYDLYDRYSPAFYGEIKRNLYLPDICNQTLIAAFQQIWEKMANGNQSKEVSFCWCFQIVRKEIQKKKVDLMLKEIFACQQSPVTNEQRIRTV